MRQQSNLQVQLIKEQFTTTDPTMIYQAMNEGEQALKQAVLQEVSW